MKRPLQPLAARLAELEKLVRAAGLRNLLVASTAYEGERQAIRTELERLCGGAR